MNCKVLALNLTSGPCSSRAKSLPMASAVLAGWTLWTLLRSGSMSALFIRPQCPGSIVARSAGMKPPVWVSWRYTGKSVILTNSAAASVATAASQRMGIFRLTRKELSSVQKSPQATSVRSSSTVRRSWTATPPSMPMSASTSVTSAVSASTANTTWPTTATGTPGKNQSSVSFVIRPLFRRRVWTFTWRNMSRSWWLAPSRIDTCISCRNFELKLTWVWVLVWNRDELTAFLCVSVSRFGLAVRH